MKKELAISCLLAFLTLVGGLLNHKFLSAYNVGNNLTYVGLWGIFSIGMGIVIITGGIDLSVGSVFALQGVLLAMAVNDWHRSSVTALLLSTVVVVLIGCFHGYCVTVIRLQPFIVTLCGLLFYRGIARWIAHDQAMGFDSPKLDWLRHLATYKLEIGTLSISMPFMLLVVIGIIMWVVLHRSVYGRYLFAVGRNEEAARFSGINTKLVIGSAYGLGMLLSAVSGVLIIFDAGSDAPSGFANSYELYGIAAAVLGGCSLRGGEGSILGIILGTALIVVLRNLVPLMGIDSSLEFAVMGAVIFIGVTVDQLLGNRKRKGKAVPGFPVVPLPAAPAAGQTPAV
jgi:ribose transport system permease protein